MIADSLVEAAQSRASQAAELYAALEDVVDPLELAAEALAKLRGLGLPAYVEPQSPDISNVVSLAEHRTRKAQSWGASDDEHQALTGPIAASRLAIGGERSSSSFRSEALTERQASLVAANVDKVEQAARAILREWKLEGQELDELVSDGYLGLIRASVNFNPARVQEGYGEGSYFWESIRGAILHGLRDRFGRVHEPLRDEAGQKIGVREAIRRVKPSGLYGSASSLDADENDDMRSLYESLEDPYGVDPEEAVLAAEQREDARELFDHVMKNCGPKDREILHRKFVLGQTQREIGDCVGFSQMHVSRRIKAVLEKFA